MQLQPIDGSFAREVTGVKLWSASTEPDAKWLADAFAENPVLVFRRQALNDQDLLRFGGLFGAPQEYAETHWQSSCPEVVFVSNMRNSRGELIGGLANKELKWHTDQSYYATPVTGCFLYASMLPNVGGETAWANLYDAYDALSDSTKRLVEDAVGTFSYRARVTHGAYRDDNHDPVRLANTPDVRHRLVHINPVTGRRALYIDPNTVTGIEGMAQSQSDVLLEELLAVATDAARTYRHVWQVGDLVLWDNAVLLHRRAAFPNEHYRILKRMIIALPEDKHVVPAAVD
ncbi:MAG: TauD/TfdA family dioxygenase [Gammaproteobacteria bacterium]|nr:TauD/TfdA family dioxygenase [Gammaproteobacteria bacterium]